MYAQDEHISVVSAEKMNIVYRGVPNPIKVAYPGADSVIVSAPGLIKDKGINNYILSAGAGNELTLNIIAIMPDGTVKEENKIFRILSLAAPATTLYGTAGYIQLTKQELINSTVEFEMENFLFDLKKQVYSFTLHLPNGKHMNITGNKFDTEAIKAINSLKNKQQVIINNVRFIENPDPAVCYRSVAPIIVEIKNKSR